MRNQQIALNRLAQIETILEDHQYADSIEYSPQTYNGNRVRLVYNGRIVPAHLRLLVDRNDVAISHIIAERNLELKAVIDCERGLHEL